MAAARLKAGERWIRRSFGVLGVVVAAWGVWLATSSAPDGEGWDPGFVRGLGVFIAAIGLLLVASVARASRRARR